MPRNLSPYEAFLKRQEAEAAAAAPETEEIGGGDSSVGLDIVRGIGGGFETAGRDLLGLVDLAGDFIPDDWVEDRWVSAPTGLTGEIVHGFSQFLAGFLGAGKIIKGVGLLKGGIGAVARGIDKLTPWAKGMVKGSIAEAVFFEGQQARLSNIFEESEIFGSDLSNALTANLANEDNDSELLGRLKNASEGLLLGGLTEGVFAGAKGIFRSMRGTRTGSGKAAAELAITQAKEAAETAAGPSGMIRGVNSEGVERGIMENLTGVRGSVDEIFDTIPEATSKIRAVDDLFEEGTIDVMKMATHEHVAATGAAIEKLYARAVGATVKSGGSIQGIMQNAKLALVDFLQLTDDEIGAWHARLFAAGENPVNVAARSLALHRMVDQGMKSLAEVIRHVEPAKLGFHHNLGTLARTLRTIEHAESFVAAAKGLVKATKQRADDPDILLDIGGQIFSRTGKAADTRPAAQVIREFGGFFGVKKVVKAIDAVKVADFISGPSAVGKVLEGLRISRRAVTNNRFTAFLSRLRINSMLSGPRTHFANVGGNIAAYNWSYAERFAGSLLRGSVTFNFREFKRLRKEFLYMSEMVGNLFGMGSPEILDAAKKAFKQNRGVINPRGGKLVQEGLAARSLPEGLVGHIGQSLNLWDAPVRALHLGDEIAQQLNYRAAVKSELHVRALEQGLRGPELGDFVEQGFRRTLRNGTARSIDNEADVIFREATEGLNLTPQGEAFHRAQANRLAREALAGTDIEELAEAGLKQAHQNTFTDLQTASKPIREMVEGFNRFRALHPTMSLIAPFVTTGVNIARFGHRRFTQPLFGTASGLVSLPKHLMNKMMRVASKTSDPRLHGFLAELTSSDSKVAVDAAGRLASAIGITYTVTTLAANQYDKNAEVRITGRGPKDRQKRETMKSAGWQPYSIQFGDKSFSYQRIDPVAGVLGVLADLVEVNHFREGDEEASTADLMTMVVASLGTNFSDKTFFRSLADPITALTAPSGRRLELYVGSQLASFIPNAPSQLATTDDQTLRFARTWLDKIHQKIPWTAGDHIEPVRNVLGETRSRPASVFSDSVGTFMNAWLPISETEVNGDSLLAEMASSGEAFSRPGRTLSFNGVSVSLDKFGLYPEYEELAGTIRIQGRTMRQELERVIATPQYNALEVPKDDDSRNFRSLILHRVVRRYRAAAKNKLLRDNPEVIQFVRRHL